MKEFDFETMKKPMPYRVPEGFFETFPERMMRRVALEKARKRIRRMWITTGAAAAVFAGVVIAGLGYQGYLGGHSDYQGLAATGTSAVMDSYVSTLSDEELMEQLRLFESDVTLLLADDE